LSRFSPVPSAIMLNPQQLDYPISAAQRPWDARLARRLVAPLKDTWVTPNHLTTVRLMVGLGAAAAFTPGTFFWSNIAALLMVLSNFLDHTDGELARMSGKTSRFGHLYDLASDAAVTILVFIAMGIGVGMAGLGMLAGTAIAGIFFMRLRIEEKVGKSGTQQASYGGFETEDVLYLIPLGTLCNAVGTFLPVAAVCAPLYLLWVTIEYRRVVAG
jgi:archaetidylinositol phosphate synthase